MRGAAAALAYAALVFGAGFALGAVRTQVLAPRLGVLTAVSIELPLMLAISWLACGWSLRRFTVPRAVGARAAMGALAFALLMGAELALALALGGSVLEYGGSWRTGAGALGLAGQLAFALMPMVRT